MKIKKKQTIFEMNGGVIVEQRAWTAHDETCITGGFHLKYPARLMWEDRLGSIRIDLRDHEIKRLAVYIAAGSTRAGIEANRDKQVNVLQFSGKFFSADYSAFEHTLNLIAEFRETGWHASVSAADKGAKPQKSGGEANAEKIVADLVCTEEFEVALIDRRLIGNGTNLNTVVSSVALRDIEGLRQAIVDSAGKTYLQKLLRMNGYESES